MQLLDHLMSGRSVGPRRVLLYGTRGIGTTSLAAALPAAVVLPCDEGVGHVDCRRLPPARRFGQLLSSLHALATQPHAFGNVVLDPLDAVERLALDEAAREHGVERLDLLPFARGHALALPYWRQLLDALDRLREERGMHCVLVGHAQLERCTDGGVATERCGPAVHRTVSALLQGWCDEVLFAAVVDRPPDPTTPEDRRAIHTRPARTHAAKNRLDLPAVLPVRVSALTPYLVPPRPAQPPQPPPAPTVAAVPQASPELAAVNPRDV